MRNHNGGHARMPGQEDPWPEERFTTIEAWLRDKPEVIQKLAKRFPHNSRMMIEGVEATVVGWNENGMVVFSFIDPMVDYERAVKSTFAICASHLETIDIIV